MATVYLADDLKHRRQVAVKVLRPELAAALGAVRFLREIGIAAQLVASAHPAAVRLRRGRRLLYYVTPYVPGGSLRERIERDGRLSVADALRIARDVGSRSTTRTARASSIAMSSRRTSSSPTGTRVLADFGIARALGSADYRIDHRCRASCSAPPST